MSQKTAKAKKGPKKKSKIIHSSESEEEYIPVASKGRLKKLCEKAEIPLNQAMKKVAKSKTSKKAKMKNTNPEPDFDPSSVLGNRTINEKSKLEDMVLYGIIKKSANNSVGASVGVVKKFIKDMFKKELTDQRNKQINAVFVNLTQHGKILNTSGLKGASGSFMINPDFANFDSRSIYAGQY